MGFIDWINEQIYIMFSMYYYEVFEYLDNIQVGRFIQSLNYNSTYLVDFKKKKSWPIIKGNGFVKGHKIIIHVRLDYAIPLTEIKEVKADEINSSIVKIKEIKKLVGSCTKEEKKKAEPITINKINVPEITEYNLTPDMIFEFFNAHFVTKIAAKGKSTDWGFVVLVIGVIFFLIAFMAIMVFGVLKPAG